MPTGAQVTRYETTSSKWLGKSLANIIPTESEIFLLVPTEWGPWSRVRILLVKKVSIERSPCMRLCVSTLWGHALERQPTHKNKMISRGTKRQTNQSALWWRKGNTSTWSREGGFHRGEAGLVEWQDLDRLRGEWKSWLKAQHSENEDHGIWSHHFMGNGWGNSGNSVRLYLFGPPNHCRWWLQPWN